MIQQHFPEIKSLRQVDIAMLDEYVAGENPLAYKRCRYVVEENNRLLGACVDLKLGNVTALGKKMYDTHEGLSKAYEVSCPELDFLVTEAKQIPGIVGARMMGGGFGGCTINLVKEEAVDDLIEQTAKVYRQQMHHELKAYIAKIEDGSNIVR